MYDARNLCDVRPGLILTQQSTCPIAAGDEGFWNHLGVIKYRRADETDTTVATTNPSVPILVADLAATSALSGSPTYDNGTAGVGAYIERGSNGTFANQDGQAITVNKLVLVTGQSALEQNGLYLCTATGGGGAKAKLVRVEELDQAADFIDGLMVVVKSGTTYADSTWKLTAAVATVGTDAVTFSRDPGLVPSADLASTANGKGASLVGVEDAGSLITGATVEAALAELVKKANAGLAAPMAFTVTLSTLANSDVVARFTPGVAGKIRKISAFVKTVVTTAAKAATLTPYIAGTTVTGGALALTSANCTPKGAAIDGSSITAANAFTAAQEITVVVSGVTTFVEGEVTVCLFFDPAA